MREIMKRILHVGCGDNPLPEWMEGEEVRLDISPYNDPDIVASMTDLGDIGLYDVVYCAHALEHLYPHDIRTALIEFKRVLATNGLVLVVVPDLEGIKPTNELVYESMGGPITGLDMFYGYSKMIEESPFMAHRYGFVEETLRDFFIEAGFSNTTTKRLPEFNLMAVGQL